MLRGVRIAAGRSGWSLISQAAGSGSAWLVGSDCKRPPADGAAVSQERMIREATAFLIQTSRTTPLVLFLDDVQWADISTLDLLLDLTSRLSGARILITVTYRPHEGRGTRNPFREIRTQLRRRGSYREIDLDFLSEADCRSYFALEFPGCQFPAGFDALVRTKTAGNPLFLVELARFLKDRGFLTQDEKGAWRLERPVAELANEAPESVRAMIQAKLDQLSDDERRLLLAASVQGIGFRFRGNRSDARRRRGQHRGRTRRGAESAGYRAQRRRDGAAGWHADGSLSLHAGSRSWSALRIAQAGATRLIERGRRRGDDRFPRKTDQAGSRSDRPFVRDSPEV